MLTTFLFGCAIVICAASQSDLTIQIGPGTVKGKYDTTIKGSTFRSFTGIPYGEPPVGILRFKPPVPLKPWNGVLDATKPHQICPQMDVYFGNYTVAGNEDCLYLNVYAPVVNDKESFSVLFYIHGGGWMSGNANSELYGPQKLLEKEIVLVTTNYRLGALGFLSTGDSVVPGNNGLKDQTLALKWVKDNIKCFGGNPNKITVFGQSAGGASAHFLTLSPLSRDLVSGAILQSGTAFAPWAITLKPLVNAQRLASYLNCPSTSSEAIVECLSTKDSSDIVEQDKRFWEYSYDPMIPFKPVVERDHPGAFLTEDPAVIVQSRKNVPVPLMIGLTTEDGALKSATLHKDQRLIEMLNKDFDVIAPFLFGYDQATYNTSEVSERIRNFYFRGRKIDESNKAELTNVVTDSWFHVATDLAVRLHAENSNTAVYLYIFGYQGVVSFSTAFKDAADSYNYGTCHGDELLYLFTQTHSQGAKFTEADNRMMDIMVSIWTNFAKTGNPTPDDDELLTVKWHPVTSKSMEYYSIGKDGDLQMGENWEIKRLRFAREIKFNARWNRSKDEL
uniref:Carboxylic ester hydrolase n=2 Tax=Photinus pyralis TaxID=7054 RepID=A0A1Y1MMB3_PHOPY